MAKSFLNQPGLPIGLRNNNPGNLRPGDNWQGMTGTNGGFLVFKDISYGIRAMAIDIAGDIVSDGLNTLRKLITEYAPPSENDTALYISRMVQYTGFSADQVFPATQLSLKKLIRGFMNVELGVNYSNMVTDADMDAGLAMMGPTWLQKFNISPAGASAAIALLMLAGSFLYVMYKRNR